MRKKLIVLACVALVLVGCAPSAEPAPAPTQETGQATQSAELEKTFCETFDASRDDYQDMLDRDEPVRVSELTAYKEWADELKTSTPAETAEAVATFTSPLYVTEDTDVSLIEVFGAGNEIAGYCI